MGMNTNQILGRFNAIALQKQKSSSLVVRQSRYATAFYLLIISRRFPFYIQH